MALNISKSAKLASSRVVLKKWCFFKAYWTYVLWLSLLCGVIINIARGLLDQV
jgi:hypothetical protein